MLFRSRRYRSTDEKAFRKSDTRPRVVPVRAGPHRSLATPLLPAFLAAARADRPLVFWNPHDVRGWALAPNVRAKIQTIDFVTTFRTNQRGLADGEHSYEPAPNVFRILVLGDSFMDACQVPFEASLPHQLGARLKQRNVEVINLGVSGYGTFQEYLYLMQEGVKYKPDLIVLAFFAMNDVHNNSEKLSYALWGRNSLQAFGRPYPIIPTTPGSKPTSLRPNISKVFAFHKLRKQLQEAKLRRPLLEQSMIYELLTLNQERLSADIWTPRADPNIYVGPVLKNFSNDIAPKSRVPIARYESMWAEARSEERRVGKECRL